MNIFDLSKKLSLGRLNISFKLFFWITPKNRTLGIYDICKNGKHIVFLDYDKFRLEWLENEIKYLQNKYKLSDFYIFQSSPYSYHAVCFDMLSNFLHNKILMETNIDDSFLNAMRFDYGSRVLRVFPKGQTKKPKLLKIIKSINNQYQKSIDHIKAFEYNYDISIKNKKNGVNLDEIYLIDYPTEVNV